MTKRESLEGTRENERSSGEGTGPVLESDETNEEEEEDSGTTGEEDTKSRSYGLFGNYG